MSSVIHSAAPDEELFVFPVSYAQQRLWFQHRLDPGNPYYNMSYAFRFAAPLSIDALELAISDVIARHEALRTLFAIRDSAPVQVVNPPGPFRIERIDLTPLCGNARRRGIQILEQFAGRPFALDEGPLVRAALVRLPGDERVLIVCMHHIVSDFVSWRIFLDELSACYAARCAGQQPPLNRVVLQYPDFSVWQSEWLQSDEAERQLRFWTETLRGYEAPLDLPFSRPRPAVQAFRGRIERWKLPPEIAEPLRELSRREGCTLFMTLLAAFQVLLWRYTGRRDLVVATMPSGRTHMETEGTIGFFVNTVPLRARIEPGETFRCYLRRVRRTTAEALSNAEVPFDLIVRHLDPPRSLSHNPIAQVGFVVHHVSGLELGLAGCRSAAIELDNRTAKFDLTLCLFDEGDALRCYLEYDTDLFKRSAIRGVVRHFSRLAAAVADGALDLPISRLPILAEDERRWLVEERNATAVPRSAALCVHGLVETQISSTPEGIAVTCEDRSYTYAQLDAASSRIASELRARGVGVETPVAVCMERSAELVASLLGVLRAGACYVPLAPDHPPARRSTILEDLANPTVLCSASTASLVENCRPGLVNVSRFGPELWEGPPEGSPVETACQNVATILYTSGSTGTPKGTMVTHAGICNTLLWMQQTYPLGASEAVLQKTSFTFDVSVSEIFGPLIAGGRVVVVPEGLEREPRAMIDLICRHAVSTVHFVPSQLRSFLADREVTRCKSLRQVFTIGEPLTTDLVATFRSGLDCRLVNLYGPTEASIEVSHWECPRSGTLAATAIGRPIDNSQLYVLDGDLNPVPVGVVGELYIGGVGLARGYFNRPSLTAECFVPDPFSPSPGRRLYRTGDLARIIDDGGLEFVGRTDQQVKIRGFRVELGEIEKTLLLHAGVKDAAVLVVGEPNTDRRLAAFVVPTHAGAVDERELRSHVAGTLPGYMVPSSFDIVASLPTTLSGKIDRNSLLGMARRHRGVAGKTKARPPTKARTPIESALVAIWRSALDAPVIGRDDNFFELGGHSLLAAQIAREIGETFGIDVPVRIIFERPTVAELAESLDEHLQVRKEVARTPLDRVDGPLPLTSAQRALWFLQSLSPDLCAYNVVVPIAATGRLDVQAMAATLHNLVQRHAVLSTRITLLDGEPYVTAAEGARPELIEIDLACDSSADAQRELEAVVKMEGRQPLVLTEEAPLRSYLIHGPERDVVLLVLHHIAVDEASLHVLVNELAKIYTAQVGGTSSAMEEAPPPFHAYVAREREMLASSGTRLAAAWRRILVNAPRETTLRSRSLQRPRQFSFDGDRLCCTLPSKEAQALHRLAQEHGTTVFACFLTALALTLGEECDGDDLVIGAAISHRSSAGFANTVGHFSDLLPVRIRLAPGASFATALDTVSTSVREAYVHVDAPFELIVDAAEAQRDLRRNPLCQVVCNYGVWPPAAVSLGDVEAEVLDIHNGSAKFDITVDVRSRNDTFDVVLEYCTSLYERKEIEAFAAGLVACLDRAAAVPDQPFSASAAAGKPLRAATPLIEEGEELCLHDAFERQARRTPDRPAVVDGRSVLVYGELDERAAALARRLRRLGAGPERLVALFLERSARNIEAVLGVLKSGSAYVPLDADLPSDRLAQLVRLTEPVALVTQRSLLPRVRGLAAPPIVLIDGPANADPPFRESRRTRHALPDSPAYVMFTSGSTGEPKGVVVTHRNVLGLFEACRSLFEFEERDVWSQFHSYAFDFSVWETWGALLHGARLVVVPYWIARSPGDLYEFLRDEGVTVLSQTPPAFAHLLSAVEERDPAREELQLRYLVFGGDVLDPSSLAPWFRRYGEGQPVVVNMYGITETTVHVTFRRMTERDVGAQRSPIGVALPHLQLVLLDGDMNPVANGDVGELYVAGAGLARGYLNRSGLTAERFLPNPFPSLQGSRLYRTGDLAVMSGDELEYRGRADSQVKIRGFRIELGEIEHHLASHPDVAAGVVKRVGLPGNLSIAAYVVPMPKQSLSIEELRSFLRRKLPEHMVPAVFSVLPSLPLTRSGKVDHAALPAVAISSSERAGGAARDEHAIDPRLREAWQRVLGESGLAHSGDFFDSGGHSMSAARLASELSKSFQLDVPVRAVFENPTLAQLADYLGTTARVARPPLKRWPRWKPAPLSFQQERSFRLHTDVPGYNAENLPFAMLLSGRLDRGAFAGALRALVQRHDGLRTIFRDLDGNLSQVVVPRTRLDLELIDSAALGERFSRQLSDEIDRPFDLTIGPPLRVRLWRLNDEKHVLLLVANHIVSDGWSINVLLRELSEFYNHLTCGAPLRLPAVDAQQQDFAAWQRQAVHGELEGQIRYWLEEFRRGQPESTLPYDHPHPRARTHAGSSFRASIDQEAIERAERLVHNGQGSIFSLVVAAWQIVLFAQGGGSKQTVRIAVAGRVRPEFNCTVGRLTNALFIVLDLGSSTTFAALVRTTWSALRDAYSNQEAPIEEIEQRLAARGIRVQRPEGAFSITLQDDPLDRMSLQGIDVEMLELPPAKSSKRDLSVYLYRKQTGLDAHVVYSTEVFREQTVGRLFDSLTHVLKVGCEAPETPVQRLVAEVGRFERH
jgi:amino acid adenylation domain-containing protein